MKTAILLDLDRTIFDTDRFWRNVFVAVEDLYGTKKVAEFKNVYNESFQRNGVVRLAIELVNNDSEKILQRVKSGEYFYDDVVKFIKNRDNIFMLSVGDYSTQSIKMKAIDLDLPLILVDVPEKAKLIRKNFLRDAKYEILGQKFDAIELYDDRTSNFMEFEKLPNASGFLVQRSKVYSSTELENLPENVKITKDFHEISVL